MTHPTKGFLSFCAKGILLLAAGGFVLPVPSRAAAGDDVIRRVQDKFKSLKNLSVSFTMSGGGSPERVEGRLFISDKGRFRLESPGQIIVSDGQTVALYSPPQNQVILYTASESDNPILSPRQLLFDYIKNYRVVSVSDSVVAEAPCDVLEMTPLDPSDPTRLVRVWIDRQECYTRRFLLEDLAGNVTVFDFHGFQIGQKFPADTFHFVPPENAEVIDMR